MTDLELLALYVQTRSSDALRILIERRLDLVYAVALRQTRDSSLAQDIVQGVFLAFLNKASALHKRGGSLSAWLFTAARYAARDAVKSRAARIRHEYLAAVHKNGVAASGDDLEALGYLLDEAISRLSPADRTAIGLYYFENQSLRNIGQALNVSEKAAHMRITRAVSRLRTILAGMQITCPADVFENQLHRHGAIAVPLPLMALVVQNILAPSPALPAGLAIARKIGRNLAHNLTHKKVAAFITLTAAGVSLVACLGLLNHRFSSAPAKNINVNIASAPPVKSISLVASPAIVSSNPIDIKPLLRQLMGQYANVQTINLVARAHTILYRNVMPMPKLNDPAPPIYNVYFSFIADHQKYDIVNIDDWKLPGEYSRERYT